MGKKSDSLDWSRAFECEVLQVLITATVTASSTACDTTVTNIFNTTTIRLAD